MSKRWVALLVGLVLVITSCGRPLGGQAQSIYADPLRVAGMPAVDGPSGMKPGVQVPKRKIENTDNGEIDDYVKVSLADIEDFWTQFYGDSFANFRPVSRLISVDSRKNNDDLEFCRGNLTDFINAAFCPLDNSFAWDRGQLFPFLRKQMGDMAMNTVMAHEYGHSIQFHAQLINPIDDPKMSRDQVEYLMDLNQEQQADCFAGSYLRWGTQGDSPRFTLNTADGLNKVMAAMIAIRDNDTSKKWAIHGSAFERVSAFQFGFTDGPMACKRIDSQEIIKRRGELPRGLGVGPNGDNWPINPDTIGAVLAAASQVFPMDNPPKAVYGDGKCSDGSGTAPASYCPKDNTIALDPQALQKMAKPATDRALFSAQVNGDYSAFSVIVSRYALAAQKAAGLETEGIMTGLRTACLTGYFTSRAAGKGIVTPRAPVILSGGDLDEAVSELLSSGRASSDVNGETAPAGFSRIDAYRIGVLGNDQTCAKRFP